MLSPSGTTAVERNPSDRSPAAKASPSSTPVTLPPISSLLESLRYDHPPPTKVIPDAPQAYPTSDSSTPRRWHGDAPPDDRQSSPVTPIVSPARPGPSHYRFVAHDAATSTSSLASYPPSSPDRRPSLSTRPIEPSVRSTASGLPEPYPSPPPQMSPRTHHTIPPPNVPVTGAIYRRRSNSMTGHPYVRPLYDRNRLAEGAKPWSALGPFDDDKTPVAEPSHYPDLATYRSQFDYAYRPRRTSTSADSYTSSSNPSRGSSPRPLTGSSEERFGGPPPPFFNAYNGFTTNGAMPIDIRRGSADYAPLEMMNGLSVHDREGWQMPFPPASSSYPLPGGGVSPWLPPGFDGARRGSEPTRLMVDDDDSHYSGRYCCPHCSKRFARPSSLRIHIHSHTGEKPFDCHLCGRGFSVQSNLRRHLKIHRDRAEADRARGAGGTATGGKEDHESDSQRTSEDGDSGSAASPSNHSSADELPHGRMDDV